MTDRYKAYDLQRYRLSLSTFGGIVPGASHYWCRITWYDADKQRHEDNAECGRGNARTMRFTDEIKARAAGLRLVERIAEGFYVVTEGSCCTIDPQKVLSAPGNLKERLNKLWREFESLDGWGCDKATEPRVQKICDSWSFMIGQPHRSRTKP